MISTISKPKRYRLNPSSWAPFVLSSLFDVKKGKRLTKDNFVKGKTPFIGAIDSNNGYRDFIGQPTIHKGNTITVNYNGSVGEAFYQPEPFWASDDVNVLYPKFNLNKYIGLFIVAVIKKEQYRFNYGRKWESKRMKESVIYLPATPKGEADFQLMEEYIKGLYCSYMIEDAFTASITRPARSNKLTLNTKEWHPFRLVDLFKLKGTKTTSLLELEEYGEGKYPYVTTQATNNGTGGYYNYFTEGGNVLTVDSAVIGYCSYQPTNFSASDHVEKLIPNFELNKYIAQFLVTVINREQYRFNYGRKASQNRLKELIIKLPSQDAEPDFNFMEDYIKSLHYSSSI